MNQNEFIVAPPHTVITLGAVLYMLLNQSIIQ